MRLALLVYLLLGFVQAKKKNPTDAERMKEAMTMCNTKCKCAKEQQIIKCNRMEHLWYLVTEGAEYVKEFSGFFVEVSDEKLTKISNNFVLKSGGGNGLSKIKSLTLSIFKSLKTINPSFFEKYFPNLEYLTVTESENQLNELTVGRLVYLKVLQVNGHKLMRVKGCGNEHRYCFNENRMELLEVPTLNLKNMGLPEYITEVKIDLNRATSEIGDEDVFKNKIVDNLRFIIPKIMTFPIQFAHIEVVDEFYFEIPRMKDEQLWALMKIIYDHPLLASRMNLKMKTNEDNVDVKFPVLMKSCLNCDFDKTSIIAENDGVCYEEQKYLDTFNIDLPEEYQRNRNLTIRGIYVDIDNLLQTLNGDSTFHVTIYAFVAKVPKTKYVNFDLKVYYAVLENPSELSQIVTLRKPYTMVNIEDSFGVPLHYAKKIDGIFVHGYSLCIAKLTVKYRNNSPDDCLTKSVPWNIFLNLPNTAIHTSSHEALVDSRTSAIQGLLNKYMYMYAEQMNTVKRFPYLSLDMQEEVAEILIESAGNILEKKRDFEIRKAPSELLNINSFHIKTILDNEDDKQIQFLKYEQTKAIALANIALRQKQMQDVRLKKIQSALKEELSTYGDMEKDLQTKSKAFIDGASVRNALGWADIGSDVTHSIISAIELRDFDYSAVTKKTVKGGKIFKKLNNITLLMGEMQHLTEKMKTIHVIYSKVKYISQTKYRQLKRNLRKLNNERNTPKERATYAGLLKRMSKGLINIQDIGESILALYQSIFFEREDNGVSLTTEELNIVRINHHIKVNDIMKWDLIKDKVECLFDEHVTIDIPESGEYKASILNMITKGKTISQFKLDQTLLMRDLTFADKSYWEHIEEYAALLNAVGDISQARRIRVEYNDVDKAKDEYKRHYRKTQKYIYYITFINKLRIIDAHKDFCDGYYYYHLKQCPKKYEIDIFTPLIEVRKKYKELVFDNTIRKPQNFNPPPQSFENFAVIIKKENNCKCVSEPYERLKDITKDRNITKEEKTKFESLCKLTCFPHGNRNVPMKAILDKLDRCNIALVESFIKHNVISIEIPVNYMKDFINYERVRIDDVQVVLDGVKTSNGKVVMKIANPGITQDRYQGKLFKFYGSPWVRRYEYCGKDIKKMEENDNMVSNDIPMACHYTNYKTLLSTSPQQTFKEFYRKPSLFSTWVISVPKELNQGLDLLQLNSIEINFSGSLIPSHTNYSKYKMVEETPETADDAGEYVKRQETSEGDDIEDVTPVEIGQDYTII